MKKSYFFLIFLVILVGIDIAIKYYTAHFINKMSWIYPTYPYGGIGVFKDFFGISFSINHVENTGAAWGLFAKYPSILFIARIFIVSGLIIYSLFINKEKKNQIPFLLITAGALGNILDFIFYKKVIDMFYFRFWNHSYPVFNFADILITTGIVWLFITFLTSKKEKIDEN